MNVSKKIAILSGILVSLGVIASLGLTAKTDTGMIKKGIKTMPAGRTEYAPAPKAMPAPLVEKQKPVVEMVEVEEQINPLAELTYANEALKGLLALVPQEMALTDDLVKLPEMLVNEWNAILERHKNAGVVINSMYQQVRDEVKATLDDVINAIHARIIEIQQ